MGASLVRCVAPAVSFNSAMVWLGLQALQVLARLLQPLLRPLELCLLVVVVFLKLFPALGQFVACRRQMLQAQ